jgi:hypothetical protein
MVDLNSVKTSFCKEVRTVGGLGMVTHMCNSSNLGSRNQRLMVPGQPKQELVRPPSQQTSGA